MAEQTVRICDLCPDGRGQIATSTGAIAWRGYKGVIDVCEQHQRALEVSTGAPSAPRSPKAAESETEIVTPEPKRRGRPPKAKPAEGSEPKRRGRPPKAKPAEAPLPKAKVTAMKKTVLTPSPATIRAWARSNNVPVSERGGIGASTLSAYLSAHPDIDSSELAPKSAAQPKKQGRRVPAKTRQTAGKAGGKRTGKKVPAPQFSNSSS